MNNTNLKKLIKEVLKKDERIWNEDKTELNQTLLLDLVEKIDETVIDLLLQKKDLREKFFVKIKDVYVFKTNDFRFFMEENKVDNSFTAYKNRIGLTDGKRFLKDTNDIVLDWPYKDCVLEGGQSTEEGEDVYFEYDEKVTKTQENQGLKADTYNKKTSKRKEIFFNQVLAHDEIDRLFDHKAFTNWKRFTKNGEQEVKEIKRDEEGTIKENLIIKGNNLLALHSLKKQFAEKVKLIYIDPPYNTGGDANIFTYNNTFNHSTWLTFMRNRLEAGKQLLRDDGFIAIAIDHFEIGYLLVLSDEIFGEENRLGIISVVNNPMGRNQAKYFSTINDFMIVYAKKGTSAKFNNVILDEAVLKTFNKEDEKGKYKLKNFVRVGGGDANLRKNKKSFWYPLYVDKHLKIITTEPRKDYFEVYPITNSGQERTWKLSKPSAEKILGELIAIKENEKIVIYEKYRIDKGQKVSTVWSDKKYNANHQGIRLLEKIIGNQNFSFPKSLYTVLDTLKIMTSDDDIILDFHAGSGTTGHATLALNKEDGGDRKFILVEQLDEHIEICNERNQKVLSQENIDDSFIYFELAKWNETAKEKIFACESLEELITFFDEMYERYFLNYNLKIKEFKEKVIHEEEFINLSLDEQKKMFIAMLDNNQMYVNKTEMTDKKFRINKEDIELTKQFYNEGV
ncbi:MAG: adenine-specific DNA-methyltransferase [Oceanotoga sp.]|uniref:site-specific DNA-methyltransferase n=1 Tax=Oceanotoga sp. TaxID=2108366 RepID=UPI002653F311|nr:site-specific DNA-methyltransferase [Oceanotoga sp.]MDN5343849.1 adenine-specific DNA-methyltransferase [Oceanotoga sp.]